MIFFSFNVDNLKTKIEKKNVLFNFWTQNFIWLTLKNNIQEKVYKTLNEL